MWNLSCGLVSESLAEGKASNTIDSVKALMKNLGLSLAEALNALGITKEEYNNYMLIAGENNA